MANCCACAAEIAPVDEEAERPPTTIDHDGFPIAPPTEVARFPNSVNPRPGTCTPREDVTPSPPSAIDQPPVDGNTPPEVVAIDPAREMVADSDGVRSPLGLIDSANDSPVMSMPGAVGDMDAVRDSTVTGDDVVNEPLGEIDSAKDSDAIDVPGTDGEIDAVNDSNDSVDAGAMIIWYAYPLAVPPLYVTVVETFDVVCDVNVLLV